jgi:hypothetical protein
MDLLLTLMFLVRRGFSFPFPSTFIRAMRCTAQGRLGPPSPYQFRNASGTFITIETQFSLSWPRSDLTAEMTNSSISHSFMGAKIGG